MKALKYKQLLLVVAGLLLVLFIVKAIFFFTAKPIVTVDYVAQFNQTSRPQNYDPNENAALYYQRAFDAFIEMPDELRYLKQWADCNDMERVSLENWLTSNTTAFKYFREAVDKPYCWLERTSSKDAMMGGIRVPELNLHRDLANALAWNARLNAAKGQFQIAFENLLACYRSGDHKCRPNQFLMDQYLGLRIKSTAIENAFLIINNYKVESNTLKYLQDALKVQLDNNPYVPSLQTEKFFAYDALQRTFIDNGKGTGRWAWSNGWPVSPLLLDQSPLRRKYEDIKERLYYCLLGPTRNDVANKIEELIELSDQMMNKTPWQIKNEGFDYFGKIEEINNSHIFFVISAINPKGILHAYYKTTAQTDALIAVLAILRYKNDTLQFPESLDKLVDAGYLQSVPNDPYSSGSLVYSLTTDGFKLYSIGEDFTDNDGVVDKNMVLRREISINLHSPDIVYWPIEIIECSPMDFGMGMPADTQNWR